jgi:hypothetical protein
MSRSEVFDSFLKIATEKGLVSKAEAEHTEQNTKNPRWDSNDISAIEALYGVKPDAPKDMDYEHNIAEVAHPNAVVVSPSYDKLNGLIENINECQNILMHIVYKEPEMGSPNQGKYPPSPALLYPNTLGNVTKRAHKDLLLSLVRVANDMDNKERTELRVLADVCLAQLGPREIKKQAFLPWILAAATILGVVYMHEHLADTDQGIKQNYSRLQSELQDFLSADITVGFGHQYDDALKSEVLQLQSQLQEFWSVYTSTMPLLLAMEKPRNAQDLAEQSSHPGSQDFIKAYQVLSDETKKLYPYLQKIEENFNNPDFKAEHTQKGAVTNLIDEVPFLHGGKSSLLADDFDDVVNAISPFKSSVDRLATVLAKAGQHRDIIQENVSAENASAQKEVKPNPFTAAPAEPAPAPSPREEASGIGEQLEGLKNLIPGLGD